MIGLRLWPLHVHYDRQWTSNGLHDYAQCRCGARRVRRRSWSVAGPVTGGWPVLADKHGLDIGDTGWKPRPPAGWPPPSPAVPPPPGTARLA